MLNAISILVAFLMHLPELIALSDPVADGRLFSDVYWVNVSSEILFTYISILLLFFLNIRLMYRKMMFPLKSSSSAVTRECRT